MKNSSLDAKVLKGQNGDFPFSSSNDVGPPNSVKVLNLEWCPYFEHVGQSHWNICLFDVRF